MKQLLPQYVLILKVGSFSEKDIQAFKKSKKFRRPEVYISQNRMQGEPITVIKVE